MKNKIGEENKHVIAGMAELAPIICEQIAHGHSVRFYPKGTSMLPMLREGIDSVVLSPPPERLKKYDIPLYQRTNGQYILHRAVKIGDSYEMIGDNQYIPEKGITCDRIIAVVTSFNRGEKTVSMSGIPYKLYCRALHYSRPVRYFFRRAAGRLKRIFKRWFI